MASGDISFGGDACLHMIAVFCYLWDSSFLCRNTVAIINTLLQLSAFMHEKIYVLALLQGSKNLLPQTF